MLPKDERRKIALANLAKSRGKPRGSHNGPKSKRATTALAALLQLGGPQVFVTLYNAARKIKDLGTCCRIAFYLYDQAYGKAPEQQSQLAGGAPVRILIGWNAARATGAIAVEGNAKVQIASGSGPNGSA